MKLWMKAAIVGSVVISSAAFAQNYLCVVDDTPMMWTGRTQADSGKLLKEYRCLRGHTTWVPM